MHKHTRKHHIYLCLCIFCIYVYTCITQTYINTNHFERSYIIIKLYCFTADFQYIISPEELNLNLQIFLQCLFTMAKLWITWYNRIYIEAAEDSCVMLDFSIVGEYMVPGSAVTRLCVNPC